LRDGFIAIVWEDKQNVNMLTHMHCPARSYFCDECGNALRPAMVQGGITDTWGMCVNLDCMTYTYSISRWTWKWMKKPFLCLLQISVLWFKIIMLILEIYLG
jgi:hypothetical protein